MQSVPDATGHFGPYGGRFVPETLIQALDQLEAEYKKASADAAFQRELSAALRDFAGRPSPLLEARGFSGAAGCRVFLKREDLPTPGRTRSTTPWASACSRAAWGSRA